MSPSGFSRNPVVTVKLSDFGPNQSIDIEKFLRSLKRDPENFSSAREGQKRRRPERSKQRLQQQPPLSKTALPALDNDNPTKELAQLPGEGAPSERHNADNEVVGSRGNTRFARAANERPKVRKVYRRKQKNITIAISTSNEASPCSLHMDGGRYFLRGPPASKCVEMVRLV